MLAFIIEVLSPVSLVCLLTIPAGREALPGYVLPLPDACALAQHMERLSLSRGVSQQWPYVPSHAVGLYTCSK